MNLGSAIHIDVTARNAIDSLDTVRTVAADHPHAQGKVYYEGLLIAERALRQIRDEVGPHLPTFLDDTCRCGAPLEHGTCDECMAAEAMDEP